MALPGVSMLTAITFWALLSNRKTILIGILIMAICFGWNIRSLKLWFRQNMDDPLSQQFEDVAQHLLKHRKPGERMILFGIARANVEYTLNRAGCHDSMTTFPSSLYLHPGWYDEAGLLKEESQLQREGQEVAKELADSIPAGQGFWIVRSLFERVDFHLITPLLEHFELDQQRSSTDAPVFRLVRKP